MSEDEKRYQIYESSKIIGAYVVVDTHLNEEHRFHNFSSARKWVRTQKSKPVVPVRCDHCEASPCTCTEEEKYWRIWGDK